MLYEDIPVIKNDLKNQFEIYTEGHYSIIKFEMINDTLVNLYHTEVHPSLAGKGIGNMLVLKTLKYCNVHNYKIVPTCPFVAKYIERHPEWKSIVENPLNIN